MQDTSCEKKKNLTQRGNKKLIAQVANQRKRHTSLLFNFQREGKQKKIHSQMQHFIIKTTIKSQHQK